MTTIRVSDGETEFLTATVVERYGQDLSGATFSVGLGRPGHAPTAWVSPDDVSISGPRATVKHLVGASSAQGFWEFWVRVVDSPETYLLPCTGTVQIT